MCSSFCLGVLKHVSTCAYVINIIHDGIWGCILLINIMYASLPHAGHALPHAGHALPHAGHSLPHTGHSLPHKGHELPHAGHALPHALSASCQALI